MLVPSDRTATRPRSSVFEAAIVRPEKVSIWQLQNRDQSHVTLGASFVIWFFIFFCVSGFCSILYELMWLRLAMAQFGVTSALVSLFLSMFMAGLGLGSWAMCSLPQFSPIGSLAVSGLSTRCSS